MKKKLACILMCVSIAISPTSALAHGGRTDSSGGHKDNKNASGLGSYHYHCGGNPAHLHTNGVCPYAKATYVEPAPAPTPSPAPTPQVVQTPVPEPIPATVTVEEVKLVINGEEVNPEQPPIMQDGRVMVPVRFVSEAFGAKVNYDQFTRSVIIQSSQDLITISIDYPKAQVNDMAVDLDVGAMIVNERTMVPVRFVAESLNLSVDWDSEAKTVFISKI